MSAVFVSRKSSGEDRRNDSERNEEVGGQMSFLEHLDEFRRRAMQSVVFILIAFMVCWFFSDAIFNFLARPTQKALAEAQRREFTVTGLTGEEKIVPIQDLKIGDAGQFVFDVPAKVGITLVPSGATVQARVAADAAGNPQLYTDEPLFTGNTMIPKGVRLPFDFHAKPSEEFSADERLIVTTATESFTLYMTVSLYAAIALSIPFLLFQIWSFVAPGLYPHERRYATPFIGLSTVSFVVGAAFAYYVLFPPAVRYLLGLGQDFRLMLRASDYFDFITLIMLAMGVIFQLPAVTYVLARIGIVNARMLIHAWRTALIVILIVSAVVSPTQDVLNLMLFAAPMVVLYLISIFIAWVFGRKRQRMEN